MQSTRKFDRICLEVGVFHFGHQNFWDIMIINHHSGHFTRKRVTQKYILSKVVLKNTFRYSDKRLWKKFRRNESVWFYSSCKKNVYFSLRFPLTQFVLVELDYRSKMQSIRIPKSLFNDGINISTNVLLIHNVRPYQQCSSTKMK